MFIILTSLLLVTNSQPIPSKQPPFACEGRYECFKNTFTGDDKMLCDGYRACYRATYEDTKKNKALCNGYHGCEGVTFSTSPTLINCRGFESCINIGGDKTAQNGIINQGGVEATDKIDCSGVKACTSIDGGLKAPWINCDGDKSCYGTKLETVGGAAAKITCNGKKVCAESSQIWTDGKILCDGDSACQNSRIQATLGIACHGKRVCKNAILQESAVLEAFGMFGAAEAKIYKIPSVIGYGFMALAGADISSNGVSTMVIDCFGWKACKGATITVQKDTAVTLNCLGNGCKGVVIYAQKQSQLTITPTECLITSTHPQLGFAEYALRDGIYADPAVKATYCPAELYFGTTAPPQKRDYDTNIIEMEEEEKAFNIALENSINEQRNMIEELLFMDENEKIEEENQYLYGNLEKNAMVHGLNNFDTINSKINYMLIGAVSLVAVFMILIIYVCVYRNGEYKAISS